jgi:catechol 2,3-dioxygenase-like lactoylglutathione lyase family enzyme
MDYVRLARAFFEARAIIRCIPIHSSRNAEVTMSTQTQPEDATATRTAAGVDLKLEVIVIPVSDVDRAKRFYQHLGWRLDADFASGDDWRLVQITPPGSPCSVMFGKGFTTAAPGSVQGTFLVVDDVEAARTDLIGRGVNVSELFHFDHMLLRASGTTGRVQGPDPEGRSYFSFASFSDPDGNSWLLQEVTTRLPGRGLSLDVPTLTELLKEAEKRHGEYEPTAPKHHWSDWYAAYIVAREHGLAHDEAAQHGALHIEGTHDRMPA